MGGDLTGAAGERVVVSGSEFAAAAARRIESAVAAAVSRRGAASVALAGGNTPRPVYEKLAGAKTIDWSRIDVFFGDERAVPPDDVASNYRTARDTLLTRVAIPERNVHRMEADRPDRERAADDYARLLPPALDVLILGIGEDGHTASLFPRSPVLAEPQRLVVPVVGPKPPPERLTITPPVLAVARLIIVLAAGRAKAEPVARALDPATAIVDCPAALARAGVWILDDAAAQ